MKAAFTLLAAALLLAALSSAVKRQRLEVQDWDCPPAPASCARPVVVGGFPFPFISDYHGISVIGDAALVSALLGDDIFHPPAFAADVATYLALLWLARALWRRRSARRVARRDAAR